MSMGARDPLGKPGGMTVTYLVALFLLGVLVLVLLAWDRAGWALVRIQRPAISLISITMPMLGPGNPPAVLTLGRDHLLQNDVAGAAADQHVRITRRNDGGWTIANASTRLRLLLTYSDGATHEANRHLLKQGDTVFIRAGSQEVALAVERVTQDGLSVQVRAPGASPVVHELSLSGGHPVRLCGESPATACAEGNSGLFQQIYSRARALRKERDERPLMSIGGEVTAFYGKVSLPLLGWPVFSDGLPNLAVPGYPFGGLRIVHIRNRGIALAPGRDVLAEIAPAAAQGERLRFFELEHPLYSKDGPNLASFIAGRTTYALRVQRKNGAPAEIVLEPAGNGHRYRGEDGKATDADVLLTDTLPELDIARRAGHWPRERRKAPAFDTAWKPREWASSLRFWPFASDKAASAGSRMFMGVLTFVISTIVFLSLRWLAALLSGTSTGLGGIPAMLLAALLLTVAVGQLLAVEGSGPPYTRPAIISWGLAMLAATLAVRGRWRIWALLLASTATMLVAAGNIIVLAMAVSADESRWLRFHAESLSAILLGSALVVFATGMPSVSFATLARNASSPGNRLPISWTMVTMFVLVLLLGLGWFAFGSEAGIPGFGQPSEAIKTLFALILAATATLILRRHFAGHAASTLVGVLLSMLGIALVLFFILFWPILSSDLSPFVIMTLTVLISLPLIFIVSKLAAQVHRSSSGQRQDRPPSGPPNERTGKEDRVRLGPFAFVQRLWFSRNAGSAAALAQLVLMFVAPVLLLWIIGTATLGAYQNATHGQASVEEQVPSFLKKGARRADSWLDLSYRKTDPDGQGGGVARIEYPDTGHQVIRSRQAMAKAPCRATAALAGATTGKLVIPGVSDVAGCVSGGGPQTPLAAAQSLGVPELQNDFILAWAHHVIGRDGAVLLALLELGFVVLLVTLSFVMMGWQAGDEDRRIVSAFFAAATIILATMVSLHFIIAWMNAFGLLPVMGQPMTFVAQGRSHFVFFAIPVVLVPLLGLRDASRPAHRVVKELPDIGWLSRRASPGRLDPRKFAPVADRPSGSLAGTEA
jgi:hypothetical protein